MLLFAARRSFVVGKSSCFALPTGSDSLTTDDEGPTAGSTLRLMRRDPVELEIFKNLYHSIAEEMGAALRRTAFSPNIKERRDYSCAVFDGAGEVIAMGDHMPVHLGSMPMSVRAAIDAGAMEPGDVVMLNDPFRGGTHLPDITLVAPVFVKARGPVARVRSNSGFAGGGARAPWILISMWLRGRIMRTSVGLMPARWDCAVRSIRRACEFLR